jgi:hypothetical protein
MADSLALAAGQLSLNAWQGKWDEVLGILEHYPSLINHVSQKKGYSALHQAAWHGADLTIIGRLLQYGADTQLKTHEQQTAYDIAVKKHAQREDLRFVLYPASRTLAQLMRKIFAQGMPELMHYPDKLLMDNLVMLLSDEVCVSPRPARRSAFMPPLWR